MIYRIINNGPKSKCSRQRFSRSSDEAQTWYHDDKFGDDSICYSVVRYGNGRLGDDYIDDYAITLCGMMKK